MDEEYIKDIIVNDSWQSYQKLVDKYQGRVFTLCFRILRNREEAEEVAQDVFVKGFHQLKKLKNPSKFAGWLLRIAYTVAIDRTRKKRIHTSELGGVPEHYVEEKHTPLVKAMRASRSELLKKAIDTLDPKEAAVITLYYLEDLPVKEIAEVTKMSIANVKVTLFRARKELKNSITKLAGSDLPDLLDSI